MVYILIFSLNEDPEGRFCQILLNLSPKYSQIKTHALTHENHVKIQIQNVAWLNVLLLIGAYFSSFFSFPTILLSLTFTVIPPFPWKFKVSLCNSTLQSFSENLAKCQSGPHTCIQGNRLRKIFINEQKKMCYPRLISKWGMNNQANLSFRHLTDPPSRVFPCLRLETMK